MVEDNKIKTKISPFAIREGEVKTFDGKDGYVSMNQIITRINQGHITDLHFKILEIVNKFEFITSRQLFQLLEYEKIGINDQDKLNNKLDQLVKTKILTRYFFTSEDGKGIYRIYCLEKMGKYLLNSRNIECKWQPTDNTRPVEMIKKRLVGNQVIIAYLKKVKMFDEYIVKPAITAKQTGRTFKASAGIKLTKNKKSIIFIFEVVRREENWKKILEERIKLYNDFYKNFVPFDSGYNIRPQLVLVCEDNKHMAETFKELVANNLQIQETSLYYTTDLRQNEESLSKSLIEFKQDEETGKYTINEMELKILE